MNGNRSDTTRDERDSKRNDSGANGIRGETTRNPACQVTSRDVTSELANSVCLCVCVCGGEGKVLYGGM